MTWVFEKFEKTEKKNCGGRGGGGGAGEWLKPYVNFFKTYPMKFLLHHIGFGGEKWEKWT
jgi:hypothetical protein